MHFLLGLIAYIVICYFVGRVVFYKDPNPESRMRKGIVLTIILTVLGIGTVVYLIYKSDKDKEKQRYSSTTEEVVDEETPFASVKIQGVKQVQKDNVSGLEISLGGEFKNLKAEELNFAVWFYFGEKGKYDNGLSILKDFNNSYNTSDGQVTIQTGYAVKPIDGYVNPDSIPTLFIPLSELHLQKNYDDINQGRTLDSEKIKRNNRVALKAGVFQGDKELDDTDFWIYSIQ